jgi:hypothetical protein
VKHRQSGIIANYAVQHRALNTENVHTLRIMVSDAGMARSSATASAEGPQAPFSTPRLRYWQWLVPA